MRLKVCGLTQMEHFAQLEAIGASFGGLIFYKGSPRYALKNLDIKDIKKYRGKVNKVGVFVNESADVVLDIVDKAGLYVVQLHGSETPKYCEKIAEYITVIKAFSIDSDDDILWHIEEYRPYVDMFLFDTKGAGYGGTGKKFDWNRLANLDIGKPFILSGGIGPDDVEVLHNFMKMPVAKDLFALDINSKFEIEPGRKDFDKVQVFYQQLNS